MSLGLSSLHKLRIYSGRTTRHATRVSSLAGRQGFEPRYRERVAIGRSKLVGPVEVLFVVFTTCGISTVERPRCVALPVPSIETDKNWGVSGVMVAAPSNLPLNGTSWSLERRPALVAFASDGAMDGLADERDIGLVGELVDYS